jgi:SecD/SecF fusion protein
MPLKGLVKFFAIALIILSLFQLSFTWFVNKKDKEIKGKVEAAIKKMPTPEQRYPNDKTMQLAWKDSLLTFYTDSLTLAFEKKAAKDPVTWDPFTGTVNYKKAKTRELQLGLDLQGGMAVTLEVANDGLLKNLSSSAKDPAFKGAIEKALQLKANGGANFISLFRQEYEKVNPNGKLAAFFSAKSGNKLSASASNSETESYLKEQAKQAFDNAFTTIGKRIDNFGVAQPGIYKDDDKGTITVELAGVKNPDQVRQSLQTSANLQFFEAATTNEYGAALSRAEAAYLSGITDTVKNTTADTTGSKLDTAGKPQTPNFKDQLGNDNNPAGGVKKKSLKDFLQSGGQSVSLGMVNIEDTIAINEMLASDAYRNNIPATLRFVYGKPTDVKYDGERLELYVLKVNEEEKALMEGDMIANSTYNNGENGEPEVSLNFSNAGNTRFGQITSMLSKNGQSVGFLAIVLDNLVYSAPSVREKIEGNARISGGFEDIPDAKSLSDVLNGGRLKAPAHIVQDYIVGPSLGEKAVKGGALSFLISFLVIFLLMLVYYNTAGWVANIALILNLLFTVGVLSAIGATLTAPGIAGLVLTIGMAVDTNVIIFERIKEELERGRTYMAAVAEGYKRSLAPVLDAHFTTFLTAFILFSFGTGSIRGFATTQMLGIFLSLFCGILLSRLITDWYTNKNRHLNYFTPISKKIFKHASFKFIEYRKIAYIISAVVLLLGVGAVINGFDKGVEYAGGRSYTVQLSKDVNASELRTKLAGVFDNREPIVKSVNNSAKVYDVTTSYLITDSRAPLLVDSLVRTQLYKGMKPYLKDDITETRFARENVIGSKKVSPAISDSLKKGAQRAAVISILVIALYIFLRFRDWRYSVGTIIALLHDILVTLAVFSFFKGIMPFPLELDQHFIAAILTVIGFSMNDTVIVFDRVREYAKKFKGDSKESIINRAINDTLSRTIMTSLTVFLTILILFIFGGDVTRGFAFAMLIGVITGTYSSIFVAAPVLVDMAKSKPLGEADFLDHHNETTLAAEKAAKKL